MNKKILIIGHNGYIGSNILNTLKLQGYQLTTDISQHTYYDIIIDCAFKGVRYKDPQDLRNNLILIYKVLSLDYGKLIYFSSGNMQQYWVDDNSSDYYLAKKVIHDIMKHENNCVILNLYSCFGGIQPNGRFIRSCIDNHIHNRPISIHSNVTIPMISINDLIELIINVIQGNIEDKSINVGYEEVMSYVEIVEFINSLSDRKVPIYKYFSTDLYMNKGFQPTKYIHNTLKSQIQRYYRNYHE